MEKANESPEHADLLQMMLNHYKDQEYRILEAAADGYPEPNAIGRHEPDALVRQPDGLLRICEVETGLDGFADETTTEQFKDFSNRVMRDGPQKGQQVPFDIAVPKNQVASITKVLAELGIKNKENGIGAHVEIWCPKN